MELVQEQPKRKLLSLKKETAAPSESPSLPRFVNAPQSVYMVWREGGDMPKRVYGASEKSIAQSHAKKLAEQTGERFYVMRSWRGFEPK